MTIMGIDSWKPEKVSFPGFRMMQESDDGYLYAARSMSPVQGMTVICSGQIENGKKWLHVSFARQSRMPSYDDMILVKRAFIGEARKAIMVLPDKANYVNLHPYCLHLWHCLDGDGLPEFSHGLGTI